MRKISLLVAAAFLLCVSLRAQDYSNYAGQGARLDALVKAYPQLATLKSLTKTNGGKDIWLLTIGTGKTEAKPAIAVIGGVEGSHLLGTEMAIGFAENLLKGSNTDSIRNLLARTTYYVFPNMSPDAMEQYFGKLRYERNGNTTETDDDRDGRLNEDGFDDLDGNGKITMMRVTSPVGDYKLHPDDARVLIKADAAKGEKGTYLLLTEGIDNDKDGKQDEDGEGGIAFNRNLTYRHNTFAPGAGDFPASEKETRALLDFLFDAFNVYAVVSFGSNNNLSAAIPYNPGAAQQRIVAGYLEPDARVNGVISDLYNKVTGTKDAPKTNAGGGDLMSWGYFHYGRYSYSTPGWWVPKAKADTAKKEKPFTVEDPAANYLRWAAQQGITNTFTDWKTVQHPDYPGQQVEVGGLDPYVLINPPFKMTGEIVKKHTEFLVKLAGKQPELEVLNLKTEKLANGLARVSFSLVNKGGMSTHTKLGERSYFLKKVKIDVKTGDKQEVVGGRKTTLLPALDAGTQQQFNWVIKGSGKLTIEAGCPTAGYKTIEVNL
ncbi:M14 family metallopeptidase [Sediminibacterium ginsengisoli]|uniref:Zinc carboxypeptidase n=1 Tax=Sediminibacterium ginsengisoli TaxID=413434 RepID=A0A1T4L9F3_9BACT|nr:M14 family metallopeptidase [Sediminibacterium ginsengisoli]SJZ51385.1 Zinc carboxypeptidase [Sediminibacterium ginsengisoli]